MMSLNTFSEWKIMKESAVSKKICIIMRGLPGTGKSTKVAALLKKYGVTQDHVFSADRWFHPEANKLAKLDINSLTLEQQVEAANDILMLWYDFKYSKLKGETQSAFLDFKKHFDKGEYKEALEVAKNMHSTLEKIEYSDKWAPGKVPIAHRAINTDFKAAIDTGITPVISDNCNCSLRDMMSCVEYATKAEYEVILEEPDSPHWKEHKPLLANKYENRDKLKAFASVLADKNTHGVPVASIESMMAKWVHNPTIKEILGHPAKHKN